MKNKSFFFTPKNISGQNTFVFFQSTATVKIKTLKKVFLYFLLHRTEMLIKKLKGYNHSYKK